MGLINALVEVLELSYIKIAILGFLLERLLLFLLALSMPFYLRFQFLLFPLLISIVTALLITVTLLFEHVVDHFLQTARLGLLLDLGPVLHYSIFEFDF